jgi:hypothetical protein
VRASSSDSLLLTRKENHGLEHHGSAFRLPTRCLPLPPPPPPIHRLPPAVHRPDTALPYCNLHDLGFERSTSEPVKWHKLSACSAMMLDAQCAAATVRPAKSAYTSGALTRTTSAKRCKQSRFGQGNCLQTLILSTCGPASQTSGDQCSGAMADACLPHSQRWGVSQHMYSTWSPNC